MPTVLILGAGLVAAPLVRYLLGLPGVRGTLSDAEPEKAPRLVGGHPRGRALAWLGLLAEEPVPVKRGGTIDILTARMVERLTY